MDEFAGGRLGPYRIESLIGRGGMGDVYLAHHERLDRRCALKILQPRLAADRELRERFVREAQAAARLNHPNIVTIYDAGEDDGVAYFAMQLVEGEPLTALIGSGGLSTEASIAIVRDVAAALDAAHRGGLVHRDVKPANIIVASDGTAMLTDFGIVHLRPEAQLTATGQLIGTPAYMAPEQIAGGEITPQTDVYQLAVVAYELLTRELPFSATEPAALLVAHLHEAPVPADQRVVDIPPAVSSTLNRALHKVQEERHATATDFADALASALSGQTVEPTAARKLTRRPKSRFDDTTTPSKPASIAARFLSVRNGVAIAVVAVALAGGIAVWSLLLHNPGSNDAESTPTLSAAAGETATGQGVQDVAGVAATPTEEPVEPNVTLVGANTASPPSRTENIVNSYDMLTLWPDELDGTTEFEDDGSPRVRLEDPEITVRKHTLNAGLADGSAYLEASLLTDPEGYADMCLLARFDTATTSGYALCFSSQGETFAYYFDESRGEGLSVDLLPAEIRAGVNPPTEWNALEMRFIGDRIWFFINDTLLGAVTHDGPRTGEIGATAYRDGSAPHTCGWGPLGTLEIAPGS